MLQSPCERQIRRRRAETQELTGSIVRSKSVVESADHIERDGVARTRRRDEAAIAVALCKIDGSFRRVQPHCWYRWRAAQGRRRVAPPFRNCRPRECAPTTARANYNPLRQIHTNKRAPVCGTQSRRRVRTRPPHRTIATRREYSPSQRITARAACSRFRYRFALLHCAAIRNPTCVPQPQERCLYLLIASRAKARVDSKSVYRAAPARTSIPTRDFSTREARFGKTATFSSPQMDSAASSDQRRRIRSPFARTAARAERADRSSTR